MLPNVTFHIVGYNLILLNYIINTLVIRHYDDDDCILYYI